MTATNVKGPWDIKYLREQPFMAFGSMMNAFGKVNQGKGMDVEAFKIACEKIWQQAEKFTEEKFNSVLKEDGMDLPLKTCKDGTK